MANEALFSVTGYVATSPTLGNTPSGVPTFSMRLAWTPRRLDTGTGDWADEPSSFASVRCYRKLAENAYSSLHKGDPVLVTGTMRIREYEAKDGSKRTNVDILAASIGHDLSRGVANFRKVRPAQESPAGEPEAAGEPGAGEPGAGEPGSSELHSGESVARGRGSRLADGRTSAVEEPPVDELADEESVLAHTADRVAVPA